MELAEIAGNDLDLQLTEQMLQDLPGELNGMFRIGELGIFDAVELAGRGSVPLSPEAQILAEEHVFTMIRIPLSIRPPERSRVRFLAIEVTLASEGDRAVSWSMDPQTVTDPVAVSTKLGLTATLAVSAVEIGPEAARTEEYIVRQPRITAFNLGAGDPAWEFLPTKSGALSGVQLLHLVVKAPKGAYWSGGVALRADVIYRQMLWNTRAIRRGDVRIASFDGP